MAEPIRPTIEYKGQPYVDEAVMVNPKPVSEIEGSLAKAFGRRLPQPIQTAWQKVKLNWVKQKGMRDG